MRTHPVDKGYAWFCALGTGIAYFLVIGSARSNGILFVELLTHFDCQPETVAWFIGVIFATLVLAAPLSVVIAEWYSERVVVIIGAMFGVVASLITSMAPDIYVVISAVGVCNGIFYAFMVVPSTTVMFAYFEKRRTLASGIAMGGGSLGQMLTPVMLTYWFETTAFSTTLVLYATLALHGIVGGALLRPTSFYAPRGPRRVAAAARNAPDDQRCGCVTRTIRQLTFGFYDRVLFTDPVFYMITAGTVIGQVAYLDSVIFIAPLAHSSGLSKQTAAWLMLAMGGVDLTARLASGWFADLRLVDKRHMLMASLVSIVVAIGMHVAHPVFWTLALLCGVVGFSGGVWMALFPPVIVDALGMHRFSKAYAFNVMCQGMLNSMIPSLFGKLRSVSGNYLSSYTVCAGMMVVSVLLLAATPIVQRLAKSRRHEADTTPEAPSIDVSDDHKRHSFAASIG